MRLAARGARDMDGGQESLTASEEVALLRAQAARIYAASAVAALLVTGLGLLLVAM